MKHYFIQQNYLPRLTLFFAGWGMDECPFMDYCSGNSDLLNVTLANSQKSSPAID